MGYRRAKNEKSGVKMAIVMVKTVKSQIVIENIKLRDSCPS